MSFWRELKVREGALAVRQDLMWDAWADGIAGRDGWRSKGKGKGKGGNRPGVRGDAAARTLSALCLDQGVVPGFR
jgi:hypothetical protein